MNDKDKRLVLYCIDEVMEGHFRIMQALQLLKETVNSPSKGDETPPTLHN